MRGCLANQGDLDLEWNNFIGEQAINVFVSLLGFPGGPLVKNSPANEETWIRPLGWEDPLGESMVTHSSILAWRIPWTEEPCGLQSETRQSD